MKKVLAGLVLAGVVAWPAATRYYGQRAQASAEQFSAAISQTAPYLSVSSSQYQKGFMRSTQTVRLRPTLPSMPGKDWPEIVIENQIEHGPFPGFSGLGAARIKHSIVWPPELKAQLAKLWGAQEPLQMNTTIALGGGGVTKIESPAANAKIDGANVVFQGLSGTMKFTANFATIDHTLNLQGVSVEDNEGKLALGKIASAGSQAKLAGTERVYTGKQSASFESLDFSSKGQAVVAIKNISYTVETSAPEPKLLAGNGKFNGASIKIANIDLGSFDYDYSLSKLHAPSMEAIVKAMQDVASDNAKAKAPMGALAGSDAMAKVLQQHLPELSKHVPKFNLDRLRVGTIQDFAQLNGTLFLKPVSTEEAKSIATVLPKIDASFNVEVTESIIRMLVEQSSKRMMAEQEAAMAQLPPEQRATMQTQMQQQAKMLVDEQIGQLVQQGFLVRGVGRVSSQLALKDGKFTVNGKEVGQGMLSLK